MIPIGLFKQMDMKRLMVLLESDRIKLDILKLLYEDEEMTFGRLRSKTHTGFKTIKKNCEFLEKVGIIIMERKVIGEKGRKLHFVKLTEEGKKIQQSLFVSDEQVP